MPRIRRSLVDSAIYHVINRGNSKQEIFHKDMDYEIFIDLIRKTKLKYKIQIFAYCLMPNHFHILLKSEELSKYMHLLMSSHVRKYHKHYGTSGHIWQGRYKSFIVQSDEHLLVISRYIEGNPVRGGLVKSAKDWKWSSHLDRLGERSNILINELPIKLPVNWTEYVDTPLTGKELEKINQSVNRQSPYGELEWVNKLCREVGLLSTINPRGRPKNE